MSVSAIAENNGEVKFAGSKVEISKQGNIILDGEKIKNGLY